VESCGKRTCMNDCSRCGPQQLLVARSPQAMLQREFGVRLIHAGPESRLMYDAVHRLLASLDTDTKLCLVLNADTFE
jgi:hypothetical protein